MLKKHIFKLFVKAVDYALLMLEFKEKSRAFSEGVY